MADIPDLTPVLLSSQTKFNRDRAGMTNELATFSSHANNLAQHLKTVNQ
jgi:hypothetical protein